MMYREEFNQNGSVKHSRNCKACFGRFDLRCHRCLQLKKGAARRPTWHPKKPSEHQRRLPW
jgi:hypothetical protein